MLLSMIFNSSYTMGEKMLIILPYLLACVVIILIILPIHELAHAAVAHWLGDDTAKRNGRLTFNPIASIDIPGAIFIILFGFGWAKPVPVNPNNFKKPRLGMALTALAGPLSNVLVSIVMGFAFWGVYAIFRNSCPEFVYDAMRSFISINISLAVFNILPVPPLDGSKVLGAFLPRRALETYYKFQYFFVIIMFIILVSGILSAPIRVAEEGLLQFVGWLTHLPFSAII